MVKCFYFSLSLFLLFSAVSYAQNEQQNQQPNNMAGASVGFIPPKSDGVYVSDLPYNWYDRKTTPVYQLFYLHRVGPASYLGGYFELEKANFEDVIDIKRLNIALKYLGKFPKTPLHMQAGSYFGFGFIFPKQFSNNFTGIDYGAILGPAYEKNDLGISLQAHAGFGYYWSSSTPDAALLFLPKIFLKVYKMF